MDYLSSNRLKGCSFRYVDLEKAFDIASTTKNRIYSCEMDGGWKGRSQNG